MAFPNEPRQTTGQMEVLSLKKSRSRSTKLQRAVSLWVSKNVMIAQGRPF